MAPRKGETDDDRIIRMYQNASQAINKTQMKQILAALKEHPQHIPTVHRQLTTLGAIKGTTSSSNSHAAASPTKDDAIGIFPAIEDGTAETPVKENQGDDELQGSTGGTEEKPQYIFDKNTTRVEQLPATYLEAALAALGPASLSKANLRNILKRGCRDYNQKLLLKYWEFATGMAPSMPLTINGNKSWDSFVSHGRMQNSRRQRRLSDLVLPVDFYSDGVYSFDLAKKGYLAISRKGDCGFQQVQFSVRACALDFQIESNWSENAVVLVQVGGPLVSAIFGASDISAPSHDADGDGAERSVRIRGKRAAPIPMGLASSFSCESRPSKRNDASGNGEAHITINDKAMQLAKTTRAQLDFVPKRLRS